MSKVKKVKIEGKERKIKIEDGIIKGLVEKRRKKRRMERGKKNIEKEEKIMKERKIEIRLKIGEKRKVGGKMEDIKVIEIRIGDKN